MKRLLESGTGLPRAVNGESPALAASLAGDNRTVVVNADSDAPNVVVVQAMLQCRTAGAEKFLFAVRRP